MGVTRHRTLDRDRTLNPRRRIGAASRTVAEALEARTLLSQTLQLPVVNAGFETLYQPGSTTVTAALPIGTTTTGFGSDFPVETLDTLALVKIPYSDGTSGLHLDVPGWTVIPLQSHPSQRPVAGVIKDPAAYGGKPDNFASIFFTFNATNNATQIRQTITGTALLPNSTYVLSADVAESGSLSLQAGATYLNAGRFRKSGKRADGFTRFTKTYKTRANPPAGDLSVVLGSGGGGSGDFDNVSLTLIYSGATPGPTPTPIPIAFGIVNGHPRNLKLTQPDGTIVSLAMSGASGYATQVGSSVDLQITDLGKGANLGITTSLGSGMVTLGSVQVAGSLRSLTASTANLAGPLSVSGSIVSLSLGTIAGSISASSIGKIRAGGTTGVIYSASSIASLKLGAVTGTVDAAVRIGSITAASLARATVLSGADLGAGGATPAAPTAALSYGAGSIGSISVSGSVTADTVVAAGVNPVDGIFGNGNDITAGAGQIGAISIRRSADDTTRFESSSFGTVKVQGRRVTNLSTDPLFVIL